MNFDPTGAEIESIDQKYRGDPKDCCRAMFQHWLSGNGVRPCSWGTLIELLEDCEKQALLEEIQSELSSANWITRAHTWTCISHQVIATVCIDLAIFYVNKIKF